jgi:hypothetical protein
MKTIHSAHRTCKTRSKGKESSVHPSVHPPTRATTSTYDECYSRNGEANECSLWHSNAPALNSPSNARYSSRRVRILQRDVRLLLLFKNGTIIKGSSNGEVQLHEENKRRPPYAPARFLSTLNSALNGGILVMRWKKKDPCNWSVRTTHLHVLDNCELLQVDCDAERPIIGNSFLHSLHASKSADVYVLVVPCSAISKSVLMVHTKPYTFICTCLYF